MHAPSVTAAESATGCQTLTAEESEDKNYYRITATTDNPSVVGYEFDFGDRESYTFRFSASSPSDRQQAVVRHTYQKSGVYSVSARVIVSKRQQTQPPLNCTLQITIGTAGQIPATGPTDALPILPIALGLITYGIAFGLRTRPVHVLSGARKSTLLMLYLDTLSANTTSRSK